jgi:putative ABC transport system ATP-binding protein
MGAGCVETADLEKRFGEGTAEARALRGVTVTIERGAFVALVGPSGCGKSTLLGILGGIDRPSAGRAVVGGLDLGHASGAELVRYRRTVGVVYQAFNLLPSLTALENVESGLETARLAARERRVRATVYLERVGLADHAHRFPAELSGGQQQRVAVARALAREPALLLADEPTGNLDGESGARVLDAMLALRERLGVTCLLATHDLALAQRADRIVEMRDGVVVGAGASWHARADRSSGLRLAGGWS